MMKLVAILLLVLCALARADNPLIRRGSGIAAAGQQPQSATVATTDDDQKKRILSSGHKRDYTESDESYSSKGGPSGPSGSSSSKGEWSLRWTLLHCCFATRVDRCGLHCDLSGFAQP